MEKSTLKNMKFGKEKLKNIWFFYKKQIIAGLLVLLIGAFLLYQCAGRRNDDLLIYFAGPKYFTSDAQSRMREAFEAVIPEEYAKSVGFVVTVIGSDPSVAATPEENEQYAINYTGKKETFDDFKTRMRLPDTVICILSPSCFEEVLNDKETLCPLAEVFDSLPEGVTEDGYGIKLSSLDFYHSNSMLKSFPEDSILCLKASSIFRSTDDYLRQIEAFKSLVSYKLGA